MGGYPGGETRRRPPSDKQVASKAGKPPTLRELEVAAAVAEAGSFRGAARKLGISGSRVWRIVKSLNDKLGVEVFASPGRKAVQLTPEGLQVLEPIRQAAAAATTLRDRTERAKAGQAAEIRVVCYPVHVQRFLAKALAKFTAPRKDVRVSMVDLSDAAPADGGIEIMARLARGEADVAIAPASMPDPSVFDATELYSWVLEVGIKESARALKRFGPAFREAWAHDSTGFLPVRALEAVPLLLAPKGFRSREEIRKACIGSNFEPRVLGSSSSTVSLFALAKEGLGVVVLPSDAYPRGLKRKALLGPDGATIGDKFSVFRRIGAGPDRTGPISDLIKVIYDETAALREDAAGRERSGPKGTASR